MNTYARTLSLSLSLSHVLTFTHAHMGAHRQTRSDVFINEFKERLQSRALLRLEDVGAGVLLNFFTDEDLWYGMEEPASPYGPRHGRASAAKPYLTPNSRARVQSWLKRGSGVPLFAGLFCFVRGPLLLCSGASFTT